MRNSQARSSAAEVGILEVTHSMRVVFQYFTDTQPGRNPSPLPINAVMLSNADIAIADQLNHRAFIINPAKQIVFQYGQLNFSGNGPDQLNARYTSLVIGDYTGQTPPPGMGNGQ